MHLQNIYKPLVSIIITAYNREKYLAEAIQSALEQDYENFEVIISNNASTDGTEAVIERFLDDSRIKYFKHLENIGMTANYKFASSQASGSFITYLSSDDYFTNKSFVSQAVELISRYQDVSIALSTYNRIIEKSGQLSQNVGGTFEKEFYRGHELFMKFPELISISFAGAIMDKQKLENLNVFDSPCTALDVMALLKLMLQGNVVCNNTPGYMLRIHGSNMSTIISASQAIDNFIYIESPYEEALKMGVDSKAKLDEWRTNAAFLYSRYTTVQFVAQDKVAYKKLFRHIETHFPGVKQKLYLNLKWNILMFFFKRPNFSLPLLKYISKGHYHYLKSLVSVKSGNQLSQPEKIKL